MKILITDGLAQEGQEKFVESGYEINDQKIEPKELEEMIGSYDALIVRSSTKVPAEIIGAGARGNLKIIGRAGIGVDNIDLEAALQHGIIVKNAPDGNTNAAAELTMGLMFAVARHIPQAHATMAEGKWRKKLFRGVELYGKTAGIIGCGRIGSRVAELAHGNGMKVLIYDKCPDQGKGYKHVGFENLLAKSDFVTLHTPGLGKALITEKELSLMKETAYLINASRGKNVDEDALYEALSKGAIAGAALDVYEREGEDYKNRLFDLPNFIGVPHIGASTKEAQVRTAIQMAEGIIGYLMLGNMDNAVNIEEVKNQSPERETYNLFVCHANKPGMIGAITSVVGRYNVNVVEVPTAVGDSSEITMIRTQSEIPDQAIEEIVGIEGVNRVTR